MSFLASPRPLLVAALLGAGLARPAQDPGEGRAALEKAFQEQGLELSLAGGWCAIPAAVCIREDLLEYVLVAPFGAAHESLFQTDVRASVLNTALLALGAEAGRNASWVERDPPPSEEELARGAFPYVVEPPTGTGFYMHAAWREEGELYFFRVEDLLGNLRTGRSMRRHAWSYLGSRMVKPKPSSEEEALAADLEGNLVNLSFFRAGNTLLTGAIDDCVFQTIWLPNAYLLPERDTRVTLILSREPLDRLPEQLLERLGFGAKHGPVRDEAGAGGAGG